MITLLCLPYQATRLSFFFPANYFPGVMASSPGIIALAGNQIEIELQQNMLPVSANKLDDVITVDITSKIPQH